MKNLKQIKYQKVSSFVNILVPSIVQPGVMCFYLTISLIVIWTIPGTIALRNFLILAGFVCGIFYLIKNRIVLISKSVIPLGIFYIIFVWVLVHFFLFSSNYQVQLHELTSLWMRVLGVIIIGTSMGIYLQREVNQQNLFFMAFYSTPLFVCSYFLYTSMIGGHLLDPRVFLVNFLGNKINAAFMSVIGVTIALAYFLFSTNQLQTKSNKIHLSFIFIGILISLVSAILVSTKNGIGVSLILIFFALCCQIYINIKNKNVYKKTFLKWSIILAIIFVTIKVHSNFSFPGWSHIIEDSLIALEIEKNQNWKNPQTLSYPKRNDGTMVADNTYERVAWAAKGVELIQKYPLGYGTINYSSFKQLLKRDGTDFKKNGLTHSAWIDFGLAFGVPGLLILFSSLFGAVVFALKKNDFLSRMAIWISLAIFLICSVAEVSFKHTFEIWMFLIAFVCACVIKLPEEGQSELELLPIK